MKKTKTIWGIAILILLIGLIGWFVADRHQSTQKIQVHNHPVHMSTAPPTTSPAKTKAESYISIKEWGVKFSYSGDPAGLSYGFDSSIASFDSKQLKIFADKYDTGNTCTNGALGSVSRTTEKPGQKADRNYGGEVAQVGKYYFIYSHTTSFCSANTKIQAEQGRQHEALINQLKTLKAR